MNTSYLRAHDGARCLVCAREDGARSARGIGTMTCDSPRRALASAVVALTITGIGAGLGRSAVTRVRGAALRPSALCSASARAADLAAVTPRAERENRGAVSAANRASVVWQRASAPRCELTPRADREIPSSSARPQRPTPGGAGGKTRRPRFASGDLSVGELSHNRACDASAFLPAPDGHFRADWGGR